jgi:DNA-directed RNA polymerase sigma subunit (sigma70/sigma32)
MNHYDDQVFANASTDPFFKARNEHAWRLRTIDKLTLDEIGGRLNVSRERARQMIFKANLDEIGQSLNVDRERAREILFQEQRHRLGLCRRRDRDDR